MTGKSVFAFRTISEVADQLGVQQHVLRFWESRFQQIKPMKLAGNRRYYRPEDVEVVHTIQHLLYAEGLSIKNAQKLLKDKGTRHAVQYWKRVAGIVEATDEPSRVEFVSVPETAAVVPSFDTLDPPQTPPLSSQSLTAISEDISVPREALRKVIEELKLLRDLLNKD